MLTKRCLESYNER